MKEKPTLVPCTLLVAFLAISLLFVIFPTMDLRLAELFFTPGLGFQINGSWYEKAVYKSVEYFLILIGAAMVATWLYGFYSDRARKWVSGKDLGVLLLLLILGPGLLVNLVMKEHWGRERPVDLARFGGTAEFSPAFVLSDQGGHSFPSGHAAAAFYLMAVAFVMARRKRLWMSILLGYSLVVAFFRIAAGGHFLSDVLTSLFIVWILFFLLYRVVFGMPPSLGSDR